MADLSNIGYESEESVYHDTKVKDGENVKSYDLDNKMNYPYLMMESETLPMYKVQVLSNILVKPKFLQEGTPQGYYNVYLTMQGGIVGLGMIHSDNMKVLLQGSLYAELDKHLMIDSETRVDGDLMYSYCTNPMY